MKKCILVVDDDNMNLARTQIILGKEYDVLTAESGMDALMRLRDTKHRGWRRMWSAPSSWAR